MKVFNNMYDKNKYIMLKNDILQIGGSHFLKMYHHNILDKDLGNNMEPWFFYQNYPFIIMINGISYTVTSEISELLSDLIQSMWTLKNSGSQRILQSPSKCIKESSDQTIEQSIKQQELWGLYFARFLDNDFKDITIDDATKQIINKKLMELQKLLIIGAHIDKLHFFKEFVKSFFLKINEYNKHFEWKNRKPKLLELILTSGCDVISLVEANEEFALIFLETKHPDSWKYLYIPNKKFNLRTKTYEDQSFGNILIINMAIYDIIDSHSRYFYTNEENLRCYLMVILCNKVLDINILVVTTHLTKDEKNLNNEIARTREIEKLLQEINKQIKYLEYEEQMIVKKLEFLEYEKQTIDKKTAMLDDEIKNIDKKEIKKLDKLNKEKKELDKEKQKLYTEKQQLDAEKKKKKYDLIIICGDFNSCLKKDCLICDGKCQDITHVTDIFKQNSYEYNNDDNSCSTITLRRKALIDNIAVKKINNTRKINVSHKVIHREYCAKDSHKIIPDDIIPSDHLPIMLTLEINYTR